MYMSNTLKDKVAKSTCQTMVECKDKFAKYTCQIMVEYA